MLKPKIIYNCRKNMFGGGNMPLTSLYTCSRCKREFNFDNIRYDTGQNLICVECFGKNQKLQKKQFLAEKPEEQKTIDFICYPCRFKFSIRKDSQKEIKCPYCGKTKLMLIKKYKNENDLIKDSMNPRFDH